MKDFNEEKVIEYQSETAEFDVESIYSILFEVVVQDGVGKVKN